MKIAALTHRPLELELPPPVHRARGVKQLNSYFLVPPFSATFPSWSGASYCVARFMITLGKNFSIRLPIVAANSSFVACIKFTEGTLIRRYALWHSGTDVAYPLYTGEVIPDSCTMLEIWNVSTSNPAVLTQEWKLKITELSEPYQMSQTEGTKYDLTDLCYTHGMTNPTLDDMVYRCRCNSYATI